MATSKDIGVKLAAGRQEFGAWFAGFKTADGELDMPTDKIGEFHSRNDALSALQKEYEDALIVEKAATDNALKLAPQGRPMDLETPGRKADPEVILDRAFKSITPNLHSIKESGGRVVLDLDVDLKTLITTADALPQADRQGMFGSALWYGNVESLFQPGTATAKTVDYYAQSTDTDNTAAVAQGNEATDSAFSWTLMTDPVETIEGWIPVSRESLDDVPMLQSVVRGLLAERLQKLSNTYMLCGTGGTPIPYGVFAAARTGVQTQAKGADNAFDAIHKAITAVEVTGDATADGIVIHPTDWQNIRLTRTGPTGGYLLGDPGDPAASLSLWGVPVRRSTGITINGAAGTAGVGAFGTMAQIFSKGGLTLEISTEHSDYATKRKVAVILYRRFAVADYRPAAFCKVTGL